MREMETNYCSALMSKAKVYFRIAGLSLIAALAGCHNPANDWKEPAALPIMTEIRDQAYSSITESTLAGVNAMLRKKFDDQYGHLGEQSYQVPADFAFEEIAAHYDTELNKLGKWVALDPASLKVITRSKVAGWTHKKQLFLVTAVVPERENEMMPVRTLSTLRIIQRENRQ